MDHNIMTFGIFAMFFGTVLILGGSIAYFSKVDNERTKNGSYGLDQAKAKAQADIIQNETLLKLNASQENPGYENVKVERD